MNEFKGTPGPWILGNVNHFHAQYVNKEGLEPAICAVLPLDEVTDGEWQRGAESQANARMLCAAPELFKAVNDFLNHFEGSIPLWLFEEAENAVAKALGK